MPGRTEDEALFLDFGPCCRWISSRLLLCCQAVAFFFAFLLGLLGTGPDMPTRARLASPVVHQFGGGSIIRWLSHCSYSRFFSLFGRLAIQAVSWEGRSRKSGWRILLYGGSLSPCHLPLHPYLYTIFQGRLLLSAQCSNDCGPLPDLH